MKCVLQLVIGFALLMGLMIEVDFAQAQRRGGFGTQTALLISDVLVLDEEKTEKIVNAYTEINEKMREEMFSGNIDFRDMSDDERQEFFEKQQKKNVESLKEKLKDTLSENELASAEDIVMRRIFWADPELRGLRMIELQDEQREKLQPLAMDLGKKFVSRGFGFFGSQQSESELEGAEKAFDEAKSSFVTQVIAILSEEQNTAWKEKSEEVEQQIEEMRERFRNFRQQ